MAECRRCHKCNLDDGYCRVCGFDTHGSFGDFDEPQVCVDCEQDQHESPGHSTCSHCRGRICDACYEKLGRWELCRACRIKRVQKRQRRIDVMAQVNAVAARVAAERLVA